MGNTQQSSISVNFNKSCHIKLANGCLNNELNAIQLYTSYDQKYQQWRWNLDQLYQHDKYLFMPKYFQDKGISLVNCQTKKSTLSQIGITVGYEPYIFTLKKQVIARKLSQRKFQNRQIKKVLKNLISAVKSWFHVYPDLSIGRLDEGNIILNSEGHIKIVHTFSFPPQDFLIFKGKALEYTEINPINCLYRRCSIARKDNFLNGYVQDIVRLVARLVLMHMAQVEQKMDLNEQKLRTVFQKSLLDEKIIESLMILFRGEGESKRTLQNLQNLYGVCSDKKR